MNDAEFDRIAAAELDLLERRLGDFDPDELEVTLASGVLTLAFADGAKVVVNSHRAAGEIWMADARANVRRAYHFAPEATDRGYRWVVGSDELRTVLTKVLSEQLGRTIDLLFADR